MSTFAEEVIHLLGTLNDGQVNTIQRLVCQDWKAFSSAFYADQIRRSNSVRSHICRNGQVNWRCTSDKCKFCTANMAEFWRERSRRIDKHTAELIDHDAKISDLYNLRTQTIATTTLHGGKITVLEAQIKKLFAAIDELKGKRPARPRSKARKAK